MGSHSDSQPEGGWLDGAYGVIAALEVSRASAEAGGPAVAVVSFQDEEGRFGALTGSQLWTGSLTMEEADKLVDTAGICFSDARKAMAGDVTGGFIPPDTFSGFIEAHIEQGPVLDDSGEAIGVVDAIVGIRQVTVAYAGEQNHAGTTPMAVRRDAFQGLARYTEALNAALAPIVTPVDGLDHWPCRRRAECLIHRAGAGDVHGAMARCGVGQDGRHGDSDPQDSR